MASVQMNQTKWRNALDFYTLKHAWSESALTLLHSYTGITWLHKIYISVANKMAICVTLLHLHPSFDSQGYHAALSPLPLRV